MSETQHDNPGGEVEQRRPVPRSTAPHVDLSKPVSDLDDLWQLAVLWSNSSAVPLALQGKPANALVVMMTGLELGLTPAQAVRLIYIPSAGLPQLTGKLLLIKLREHGHTYDWKYDEDGNGCTFWLTRKDEPGRSYEGRFTLEDAVTAGLAKREKDGSITAFSQSGKPKPWMLFRKDLLFWRAVANCVNKAAPEVTFGLDIQGAAPVEAEGPVDLSAAVTPQPQAGPAEAADLATMKAELAGMDRKARESAPEKPAGRRRQARQPQGRTPAEDLRLALQAAGVDPGSLAAVDLCSAAFRRPVTSLPELSDGDAAAVTEIVRRAAQSEDPTVILAEQAEGWLHDWEAEDPESFGEWQQARDRRPS